MKGIIALSIALSICCLGTRSQPYNAPYQTDHHSVIPPLKTLGLFGANNYGLASGALSFPSLLSSDIFPAGSPIQSIFSRNPFLSAHSVYVSPLSRFFQPSPFGYSGSNEVANPVSEIAGDYNMPEASNQAASYPMSNSYGSKNLNAATHFSQDHTQPVVNYPQNTQMYQQPGPNFQQPGPKYPQMGPDYSHVRSDYHQAAPEIPHPGPPYSSNKYLEEGPVPFNLDSPQPPSKNQPNQRYPQESTYNGHAIPAGVPFYPARRTVPGNQPPRQQQPADNTIPGSTEDEYYDNDDDGRYTAPAENPPMQPSQYGQSNMVKPLPTNIKFNRNGPPVIRYLTSSYEPPTETQNEIPINSYTTQPERTQPVKEEAVVYAGPLPKSNDQDKHPIASYALKKIAIPYTTYTSNNVDNPNEIYNPKSDSQPSPSNNYNTESPQSISVQSVVTPTPYEMMEYNYDYTYPESKSINAQSSQEAKDESLGYLKNSLSKETAEATEDGNLQPIPMQDTTEEYESNKDKSDEFTCIGRTAGHYGDPTQGCQVFHICQSDGRHDKFTCPKGTLFNRATNVCDFPYKIIDPC